MRSYDVDLRMNVLQNTFLLICYEMYFQLVKYTLALLVGVQLA